MTIAVTHSTPADASFSASGATAWNANHTLTGVGTMATQNANSVTITGGTLNGVAIGQSVAGDAIFDVLTANVTNLTNVTSSAGIAITGTFTGSSPSDGLVMDYSTGWGRFSAFGGDGFQWYNAGLATTKLMEISSAGALVTLGTVTANGVLLTGNLGTVTSVTGTAPVVSSGGTTPAISMAKATGSVDGYLSSTDWTTFNGKGSGTVTSVAALTIGTTGTDLSSTVATGTSTPVITLQVPTASATNRGALSSTDWSTFNGKQAALVSGTNIKTINGNSLLGSGDVTVSASAGGSTTQVQYNSSGALAGASTFTWDGTTLKATNVETTGGVLVDGTFSGTYVDGLVLDYVTGAARLSAGGSDGIKFYNGGVGSTLLGEALNNGNWDFNGTVIVGLGTAIGGATNPLVSSNGSANNYVQTYVHNDSTGISASADLVCYPDNGTDASGWADLGITSSGYADTTFTCTGPNEGYLFMSALSGSGKTGNMVYATDSTGTQNYHKWFVGGFTQATSAWKMQLSGTALTLNLPLASTVATGTAPFTIASTTQVANLNASTLGGATFAAPGAIGGTTPSTGSFTSVIYSAGTSSVAPIVLTAGTNLSAVAAGAIEFDTTNTIAYFTGNTTNGRGLIPAAQYFRLTANGSATATTISPFFGTTSSIPLVANGVYEIEIEAYFLKNTAGTVTWTITNSAVITNMTATMIMTAVTGMATAGSTIGQGLVTQTAAAAAFAATASLTTAVNHWAKFKIVLENASSTSVRLNITNGTGTVTPLRGSFWKATRIANAGTYAA